MFRCKPEVNGKKENIYLYRKIKVEKGAAAHRSRSIRPRLMVIAIDDKDFIVSPSNRKTDERALTGERKKNEARKKENRNGGGDKATNA